jgi:hypothetical protein
VRKVSANIYHTSHNGETALVIAAVNKYVVRRPVQCKWVVKAGADPHILSYKETRDPFGMYVTSFALARPTCTVTFTAPPMMSPLFI